MNRFSLLLYFSFAFLLSGVDGSTPAQVNNLISTLLQGYDKRTRPVNDQDKAVKIHISFYLSIVNDIDEVAEKFVTTGWLSLSWTDQNLVWDYAANHDIYSIHLNQVGHDNLRLRRPCNQLISLRPSDCRVLEHSLTSLKKCKQYMQLWVLILLRHIAIQKLPIEQNKNLFNNVIII